jgi:hypothetical protein
MCSQNYQTRVLSSSGMSVRMEQRVSHWADILGCRCSEYTTQWTIQESWVKFPAGVTDFSLLRSVQTGFAPPPPTLLYSIGTDVTVLGDNAIRT